MVLNAIFNHILSFFVLQIGELQKPNYTLVLTYAKMLDSVKEMLLKYLFEEMKITKYVVK